MKVLIWWSMLKNSKIWKVVEAEGRIRSSVYPELYSKLEASLGYIKPCTKKNKKQKKPMKTHNLSLYTRAKSDR